MTSEIFKILLSYHLNYSITSLVPHTIRTLFRMSSYCKFWHPIPCVEQETVTTGIEKEGSNLSGVSAKCSWEENLVNNSSSQHTGFPPGSSHDALTGRDLPTRFPILPPIRTGSSVAPKRPAGDGLASERSACSSVVSEISRTRTLRGIHVRFGLEAAMLLPLALRWESVGVALSVSHLQYTQNCTLNQIMFHP